MPCWRCCLQNQNSHYILNSEQTKQSSPGACLGAHLLPFAAVWSFLSTYSVPVLCGMLGDSSEPEAGQASVLKELTF